MNGRNLWTVLIVGYTCRLLTRPEDRLHAFQEISDEIKEVSGEAIHYGMLAYGSRLLAWYTNSPSLTRSAMAPTWSWLCLDACISGPHYWSEEIYEEFDAYLSFNEENDFQRMTVTAFLIDGASWGGKHPWEGYNEDGICLWDLSTGIPDPHDRTYLLVAKTARGDREDSVLVLNSAGPGVYQRTGIYFG